MSLWVAGESWLCLDSWIQISGRHWSDGVDVLKYCKYNPGIKKIVLMVICKLLIAGQYSVFLFFAKPAKASEMFVLHNCVRKTM